MHVENFLGLVLFTDSAMPQTLPWSDAEYNGQTEDTSHPCPR